MNLEKAIKVLKKIRERCENHIKTLEENNAILKRTGLDEVLKERRAEFEAIDTVLTELDRLQKESVSKNKILDKMVEVKLEFFNNSKDNDSFNFAYSNEYAHIEEVLRELLEEGE